MAIQPKPPHFPVIGWDVEIPAFTFQLAWNPGDTQEILTFSTPAGVYPSYRLENRGEADAPAPQIMGYLHPDTWQRTFLSALFLTIQTKIFGAPSTAFDTFGRRVVAHDPFNPGRLETAVNAPQLTYGSLPVPTTGRLIVPLSFRVWLMGPVYEVTDITHIDLNTGMCAPAMLLGFSSTPDENCGGKFLGTYDALINSYRFAGEYGDDAKSVGNEADLAIPNVWVPYVLGYDKGIRTTASTRLTESPFSPAFKAVKWSRDISRMAWVFEIVKVERVLNDAKGDTAFLVNYMDDYPHTWPNGDATDYSNRPSYRDLPEVGVWRPSWRDYATWATFEDLVIAGRAGARLHLHWPTDVYFTPNSFSTRNCTGITYAQGHLDNEGTLSDPFDALSDVSNRQLWDVAFSVTLEEEPVVLAEFT
jgi:hypothetical protein